MHHAPLIVERSPFFCCMTTFHFKWDLPLTLPSPRDGANKAGASRGERMKGEGTCVFYATSGFIRVIPDRSVAETRRSGWVASRSRFPPALAVPADRAGIQKDAGCSGPRRPVDDPTSE